MIDTEPRGLSDVIRGLWLWLIPLAGTGGLADYLIQVQRGVKPSAPFRVVVIGGCVHTFIATFFGCLSVLVCGALGHTDDLAYGAAAGAGGFMGVRVFDLLAVLWRVRTGMDVPK